MPNETSIFVPDNQVVSAESLGGVAVTAPTKDILITPGQLGTGTSQIEFKYVSSLVATNEIKTIFTNTAERVTGDTFDSPAISISSFYNGTLAGSNIFIHPRTGIIDAISFNGNLIGSVSGLTFNAVSDGFTIAGGTTSRTLSVSGGNVSFTGTGTTATMPSASSTLTGTTTALTTSGIIYATGGSILASTGIGTATQVLLGGATPAFGAINLATMTTGTVSVSNGGTGVATTPTNGQLLIGNGAGYTLSTLAFGGTSGLSATLGSGTITINSTATSANTASAIVARDTSGNFSAGVVTTSQIITTTGQITTTPAGGTDLVNKNYVDFSVSAINAGLSTKSSVRAATNAPGDVNFASFASNTITTSTAVTAIDSVTLVVGNRVLIKDLAGANAPYNGIFSVVQLTAGGQFVRTSDANTSTLLGEGSFVFVEEGVANINQGWIMNTPAPTLNTTNLSWTQFTGVGDIFGGQGLTKSGNTLSTNIGLTNSTNQFTLSGGSTNQVTLVVSGTSTSSPLSLNGLADGYTLIGGYTSARTLTLNTGNLTLQGNGGVLTMGTGNITLTGNGNTLALGANLTVSGANTVTFAATAGGSNVGLPSGGTLITGTPTVSQLINGGTASLVALQLKGTSNGTAPNNIFESYTNVQTVGVSTPAIYINNSGVLNGNGSGLTNITSSNLSTVQVAQGGTGLTSVANGTLIFGSGGASLNTVAIGGTGTVLISSGTAPTWGTISLANGSANISGVLSFANGGVGVSLAATSAGSLVYVGTTGSTGSVTSVAIGASGGILWSNGTSPAWIGAGTAGQFLQSTGAGAPTWSQAVTSVTSGVGITVTGTSVPSVAINQAFSPIWTGVHTFNGSGVQIALTDSADSNLPKIRFDLTSGQQTLVLGSDVAATTRNVPISITMVASGAIGANTLIKLPLSGGTASGAVQAATTDTNEIIIGVSLKSVATGVTTYVAIEGKVSINADAVTINIGDYLGVSSTTSGYVTSLGQSKPAGGYVGRALSSKGAVTGLIDMFIFPNQSTTTGSVTGTGSQYTLAMFSSNGSQIGNSLVSQNAGATLVTVNSALTTVGAGTIGGNLFVTGTQVTIGGATAIGAITLPASTSATGGINFGADAGPAANLYRSAVGVLKTDGSLAVATGLNVGPATFNVSGTTGSVTVKSTTDIPSMVIQSSSDTNASNTFQVMNAAGSGRLFSVSPAGTISSVAKSFNIVHPTKPGMRLVYGCLEGPEHGVYQRGEASGKGEVRVNLPDYWYKLVGADYTVTLASKGNYNIYISSKDENGFTVKVGGLFSKFKKFAFEFNATGSRTDVSVVVEQPE